MTTSKARMYSMLKAGALGNVFPVWETADEFMRAVAGGFSGLVGVRSMGPPGLPYFTQLQPSEALRVGTQLTAEHGYPVRYYEASPDHRITIQGEFSEGPNGDLGAVLEYSRARTHMRAALAQERIIVIGPGARLVLKSYLSEASYEDFLALGERFPGAVIEFTAYETFVGELPGRNHVVWEVRSY